jgi:hypothetical protein
VSGDTAVDGRGTRAIVRPGPSAVEPTDDTGEQSIELRVYLLDVAVAEQRREVFRASASVQPVASTYSFRSARLRRSTATTCQGRDVLKVRAQLAERQRAVHPTSRVGR